MIRLPLDSLTPALQAAAKRAIAESMPAAKVPEGSVLAEKPPLTKNQLKAAGLDHEYDRVGFFAGGYTPPLQTIHENPPVRPIPHPKPKRNPRPRVADGVQEKEGSLPRVTICFTGFRVRPLDPDNFAGSIKDLLDGCRHAGLIHGDEPWRIILKTEQEKVKTFAEERTEITIETP
jgi:hypothetical protein